MTGNAKSSSEKATNFCHYYHNLRFETSHQVVQKDEVVVAALNSYNVCKSIEARTGVIVTHKFADPDSVLVNFDFKNANTFLRIDGVLAKNLICRSNAAPRGKEALNSRSTFEMRSNFVIACARVPNPRPDNGAAYVYLPASLAIGTNIDLYTLSVSADSVYNNNLASAATTTINGLKSSLEDQIKKDTDLTKKFTEMTNRISNLKVTATKATISEANPGGGMWSGCGSNIDDLVRRFCGTAPQTFKTRFANQSGGRCGSDDWIIACANY